MTEIDKVNAPQNLNNTFQGPEVQSQTPDAGKEKVPGLEYVDQAEGKVDEFVTDENVNLFKLVTREAIETGQGEALVSTVNELLKRADRQGTIDVVKNTLKEITLEPAHEVSAQQVISQIEVSEVKHEERMKAMTDGVLGRLQEGNPEAIKKAFQKLEADGEIALAIAVVNGLHAAALQTQSIGQLAFGTLDQLALVSQNPYLQQKIAMAAAETPWAEELRSKENLYTQANQILERQFAEDESRLAANPDLKNMTFAEQAAYRKAKQEVATKQAQAIVDEEEAQKIEAARAAFESDPLSESIRRAQMDESGSPS